LGTLLEALKIWLRLLAPFAPHLCEELWSEMGGEGFISLAEWPQTDERMIDVRAEEQENLIVDLIEDTLNVLKATKIAPKRICYYTASMWKWKVYLKMLEEAVRGEVKMNEIMRELAADKELRPNLKAAANFAAKNAKALSKVPENRRANALKIGILDEKRIIEDAAEFLKERFGAQIMVYGEEDKERYDPKQRATMAVPLHPAIFLE
jgi:leucyl-tRNA synthetase